MASMKTNEILKDSTWAQKFTKIDTAPGDVVIARRALVRFYASPLEGYFGQASRIWYHGNRATAS